MLEYQSNPEAPLRFVLALPEVWGAHREAGRPGNGTKVYTPP